MRICGLGNENPHSKRICTGLFFSVVLVYCFHLRPLKGQWDRYIASAIGLAENMSFGHSDTFLGTVDVFTIRGQQYSTVTPGLPVLLAPICKIFLSVTDLKTHRPLKLYMLVLIAQMILLLVPAGYAAVFFYLALEHLTQNRKRAWVCTLIYAFGSPAFLYSVDGLCAEGLCTSLITIGLALLILNQKPLLRGLCYALAIQIGYPAIPIACLMVLVDLGRTFYLHRRLHWKNMCLVGVPALLSTLALLQYHAVITGDYWTTTVDAWFQTQTSLGHFVVDPPLWKKIWMMTFSPARGVFLYFPAAILFCFSLKPIRRDWLFYLCSLTPIAYFLLVISTGGVDGGSCFGPRRLVLLTPFVILLIRWSPMRNLYWAAGLGFFIWLAGASIVYVDNLFTGIQLFLLRGPYPDFIPSLQDLIFPILLDVHIQVMTPFFPYVFLVSIVYFLWRKRWPAESPIDEH